MIISHYRGEKKGIYVDVGAGCIYSPKLSLLQQWYCAMNSLYLFGIISCGFMYIRKEKA